MPSLGKVIKSGSEFEEIKNVDISLFIPPFSPQALT
jgi:hypothetical protein